MEGTFLTKLAYKVRIGIGLKQMVLYPSTCLVHIDAWSNLINEDQLKPQSQFRTRRLDSPKEGWPH